MCESIRAIKPRKTALVAEIVKYANKQLARQDEFVTDKFKAGICVMVQEVLFQANQYQGYNNIYWLERGYKEWHEAGEPDFPEKDKYIYGEGGKECPKYGEYSRMYYYKHIK